MVNFWDWVSHQPIGQVVGLTLVHSLWQGALVAGFAAALLWAMKSSSARSRYAVTLAALATMLLAPVATLLLLLSGVAADVSSPIRSGFSLLGAPLDPTMRSPWLAALAAFWMGGSVALQTRVLLSWFAVQALRTEGVVRASEECQRICREISGRLGVRQLVEVVASTRVEVPSVAGFLRPVILLPVEVAVRLTPSELRAVIAHELAHVKRHDYLVNVLQGILESLLFFHPATWWLSNRLRVEREYCCDDMAASVCGSRLAYARALSSLEELRHGGAPLALAATGGSLMKRIARLFDIQARETGAASRWLAPLVTGSVVSVAVFAFGVGCGEETETPVSPADASSVEAAASDAKVRFGPDGQELLVEVHPDSDISIEDLAGENEFFFDPNNNGTSDGNVVVDLLHEDGNTERIALERIDEDAENEFQIDVKKVKEAVHNGEMTKEEADEHLQRLHPEVELHHPSATIEDHQRKLDAAVAAGKMSKEEAAAHREKLELHMAESGSH